VASFVLLAAGRHLVSPEQDLLLLTLSPAVSLVVLRAIDGGLRGHGFSVVSAMRACVACVACVAPALLSIGGAVLASGRFVIAEMVADQGGMPWRWAATQNPGLFCLGLVLVASAAPEALESSAELPLESPYPPPLRPRAPGVRALLRLSEWAYLWVMCGLAVALFYGGFRVPFTSPWSGEHSRLWLSMGALIFVAKLVLVVCTVGAVRLLTARIFVEHIALLALRWVLPASAASLVLALAWAAALDGARSRMAAEGAGYALSALALVLAVSGARIAWSRRAPPLTAVNPWL
jgi:NADH-quinone oxidoreductase subunit H